MGLIVKPVKAPVQTSPVAAEIDGNSLPWDAGEGAGLTPTPLVFMSNLITFHRGEGFATDGSLSTDLAGNGHNATQGTAANQPVYNAASAAYNNRPTYTFDATNDYMTIAHHLDLGNTQDWMAWAVLTPVANAANLLLIAKDAPDEDWNLISTTAETALAQLRDNDDNSYAGATSVSVMSSSAPNLVRWRADVSACQIEVSVNGETYVTATDVAPANIGTSALYFGSRAGTAPNGMEFAEFGFKHNYETVEEAANLTNYVNNRYGLSL